MRSLDRLRVPVALLGCFGLFATGCGRDTTFALASFDRDVGELGDSGPPDGSQPDFGLPDGGFPDGAVPDFGFPDGAVPDFGFPDGAVPDFGVPDGGFPDFGVPDGGFPDFGVPDGGFPDFGIPDGGFPDFGIPDGGFPDFGTPDVGVPDGGPVDTGPSDGGIPCAAGCGFLDDDCNLGVCGPDNMTCIQVPRINGTRCEDGDLCSSGDRCRLGVCIPGNTVDCTPFDDQCNQGICQPSTGQCTRRPLAEGTPCDDNDACTSSSCRMGSCLSTPLPPPPGDTCSTAMSLSIAPGAQSQTGNNTCATDTNQGSCVPNGGGAELIYTASFNETRRIRLETINPASGASYDTVVYANEGVCGPTPNTPICDDDGGQGVFSLVDETFAPGTWFFMVDGFGLPSRGNYELMIDVDPHDTCDDPSIITIPPVGQTTVLAGNTSGNGSDYTASCANNARSSDQVWTFTLNQTTDLRFETVTPPSGRFDTALHIRSGPCVSSMSEIACDDDAGQGTFSRIQQSFAPGTYFLIVDGFAASSSGEYRLEVEQLMPATALSFPATGDARQPLVGNFSSAGQFVEGIRNISSLQVRRLDATIQLNNNLVCSGARFLVRLNNQDVGNFTVRPGDTSVTPSLTFPAVSSPTGRYNIRYELLNDPGAACGDVGLPNDVSTLNLGN